ncbi:MAG: LysR family transcriptional regulator [Myxococcota bacterium]
MNYNHLRYFWAVAREGNLTRAARALRVSQSSVSVQIQKLEEELGHPLFERRGKRLVLTEAGQIALDHADAIFALGDELVGRLRFPDEAERLHLRVGALATLSRNFQLEFLQPMFDDDRTEVSIRSGAMADLLDLLEAHRLDVVLTNSYPSLDKTSRQVVHVIAEQPVSLVAPPGAYRRTRAVEHLVATERLVLPSVQTSIRAGFDAWVARLGIRPTIAAEVDDMAMLRLVARSHTGLSLVPPVVVKDELDARTLVEVERLAGLKETFFAVTLERRFPHARLQELLRRGEATPKVPYYT